MMGERMRIALVGEAERMRKALVGEAVNKKQMSMDDAK